MLKPRSKEELVEEFRIESIQEAALRVIARKGVNGASMQEIAEEAGISKGTIYLYFQNQTQLLEKTVDFAFTRVLEALTKAFEEGGTYWERFERMLRTQITFLHENRELLRMYRAVKFADGAEGGKARCDRAGRPQYHAFLARIESFLQEAMDAGEVRPANARRLALFLQEGVMAVQMERFEEKDPLAIDDEVRWLMDVMKFGISTQRSDA